MKNIEEKIEALVEPIILKLEYDLYDVEYIKEGKDYFLRIYIDSDSGISLEDCEKVSNAINDVLDSANLIEEQYFLEISSPGIERTIRKDKQLAQNIGKELSIKFFKPYNGKKQMQGTLEKFDEENIYINLENKILDIPKKDIAQIRTVYEWN